jgi:hypothetical protein
MMYVILLNLECSASFHKTYPVSVTLVIQGQTRFFGLDSLEYRRLITDLVMMYKIFHNLVDVDHNTLITLNSTSAA